MTAKEKHLYAKRYLQRGRVLEKQIKKLQAVRLDYVDRTTSITAAISPVKVQTSHSGKKLEDAVVGMVYTEKEIEEKITELQITQWKLMKEIQQVHDIPYEQMLYKVFIECKHPNVARKEIRLIRWKGQYNRDLLLRDSIDAFAECHPEIFEEEETKHE